MNRSVVAMPLQPAGRIGDLLVDGHLHYDGSIRRRDLAKAELLEQFSK
jgi:hypothetical protein